MMTSWGSDRIVRPFTYTGAMPDVRSTLRLLNPEWQGYGLSGDVYEGALALAEILWPSRASGSDDSTHLSSRPLIVETPPRELLATDHGVLGLTSIAMRFERTIGLLRRRQPDRLIAIGGTCGSELAPVSWLNERHRGELTVLWLDAHADLNTPASSPSGHFHGMVLRTLLGDGPAALTQHISRPLTAPQVVLVGARDLDLPEADFVREAGIRHSGADVFDDPEGFAESLASAGTSRIYVHLDVDVIDPADFGSALLPVPGGPTLASVGQMVNVLAARLDLAGLSILEYCHRRPDDGPRLRDALAPVV